MGDGGWCTTPFLSPLVLADALKLSLGDRAEALQEMVPAFLGERGFLGTVAFVLQLLPLHLQPDRHLSNNNASRTTMRDNEYSVVVVLAHTESSAGRGRSCLRQRVPVQLSFSCEELPVSEAISRVHDILGLRHRSLVGLCERMSSKSFFG